MSRFSVSPVNETAGPINVPLSARKMGDNKDPLASFKREERRESEGFNQLTRERLPQLDAYRPTIGGLKRPSIGELHGDPADHGIPANQKIEEDHKPHFQLGWIQGVMFPVLLNIWGVMLFLRVSWVVGESGIIESMIIVGISGVICFITTLSLSAISTNGEVKGGGIYYIISRSLGPEFGASVGIVFAIANAVAASMNTIGFCDSMNDLLKTHDLKIFDNGVNDTRLIGTIAILVMIIICAVGMEWEVKAQNFLVFIIVSAMLDFLIGTALGPANDDERAKGFVGFSKEVFESNLYPDYRFSEGLYQNCFTVFAIYFPAVTGVQAGANICGDLKDPASSIPKGTLWALFISTITYVVFVIFAGGAALRDASGNVAELANSTGFHFDCVANQTCEYGLQNSYSIMQLMSVWGWLIYAGCFAATLSTALTNLLSVPRLLQGLGLDRIYPGMIFFSKGYGKANEPYRGYVLVFFVSVAFLLIADLNAVAPLITNFYLAAYSMINFCTFHAAFVKPLGWRPSFKFYSAWLSLFGGLLCVGIMFFLSWQSSLVTFGIIFALYLIVVYRKPDVNWGSSTQEQTYRTALSATLRLKGISEHIKNYHPQILVLAGGPQMRPPLVDFAYSLTKNISLLIVGDIIPTKISHRQRIEVIKEADNWLEARKVKAFYNMMDDIEYEDGVRSLLQVSGFGKFTPNILMMGYKSDWRFCSAAVLKSYFNVLHNAFESRVAISILRLPNGLDFSQVHQLNIPRFLNGLNHAYSNPSLVSSHPALNLMASAPSTNNFLGVNQNNLMHSSSNFDLEAMTPHQYQQHQQTVVDLQTRTNQDPKIILPKEIMDAMNVFNTKQPKGTIDVWWLYDDGGLTMLLPYILSTRSNWANCKIRVFALSNRKQEMEVEEKNMANLLSKLRIDYSSLTMLQGINEKPKESTILMHKMLLQGFMEGQNDECFVSQTELDQLKVKTDRQLRLREMLLEHSKSANLVVMSLPVPRKGTVSAPLYLSWLEVLTKDMPPFLLVRGNQTSVLTFYS